MIGVFSGGIIAIPYLDSFLGEEVVYRPRLPDPRLTAVADWGAGPKARTVRRKAEKYNLPYISLDDGFLPSLSKSPFATCRHISLIADRSGIYHDPSKPSDLENLLSSSGWEDHRLLDRARAAIGFIIENRLSRYNHTREVPSSFFPGSAPKVLVVDQPEDASGSHGTLAEDPFVKMLDTARLDNPDADLYIMMHPGTAPGEKTGCLGAIKPEYRVTIISGDFSPFSLLDCFDRIYTVSSHLGFEALLLGKETLCFGIPFYAGWGQTTDAVSVERRSKNRTVEEIFAAAYILYPRYVNPYTGERCEIEDALEILRSLGVQDAERRGTTVCSGFMRWKRPYARAFLSSSDGAILFENNSARAIEKAKARNGRMVIWAARESDGLARLAERDGVPLVRMEDGFLRSVGLGSNYHRPLSLILDKTGIYYDPSRPSDLELLLEKGGFGEQVIVRAKRLREEIINKGITKYNTGSAGTGVLNLPADRRIILVPGQVEDDASVRLGSPEIKTNLELLKTVLATRRDAFVIYKPHPDVESGNRAGRIPDRLFPGGCDMIARGMSMGALIPLVDEVHTMTSLTGFEALIRGKDVFTYGGPFYAGWGLTHDRLSFPRRSRKVTLDELVAAALILYPSYYDWKTGLLCGPETVLLRLSSRDGPDFPVSRIIFRAARHGYRLIRPFKSVLEHVARLWRFS